MEKKTPLYDAHVKAGGKIVPFAGYLLPIQYGTGVIKEHMAVRQAAGMFDVSHMGEILCQGPDALKNLNYLLTNDFTGMTDGQARYSPMCNEAGGTVDDLIVYRKGADDYLIVVNAANKEKDYKWLRDHQTGDVSFTDVSDDYAQIALQGPKAFGIMNRIAPEGTVPDKYYHVNFDGEAAGIPCIVSTTGYTGEEGVEIYLSSDRAEEMWTALLEAGKEDGLIPCGLGARDTLRLEAGMPLYGHEMDENISPREAGLGFAVKMGKEDFIGKEALEKAGKPEIVRVGLSVTGRGIVREEQDVMDEQGNVIGRTTSGTKCPSTEKPVAMARVPGKWAEPGTKLIVDVRGRNVETEVVKMPFYTKGE